MKRIGILIMTLALLCGAAFAQEHPALVAGGVFTAADMHPLPVSVLGFKQNLHEFKAASGETRAQLFVRPLFMYVDDYYLDGQEVVAALDPLIYGKFFKGPVTFGIGFGGQFEVASSEKAWKWLLGADVGWRFAPNHATLTVGCQVIPRNDGLADQILLFAGLSADGPKIIDDLIAWAIE